MAVTSLDPATGLVLTSIGPDTKLGDEVTLSIGNPITGGEFTTYRLGKTYGVNKWGETLFDLQEAEILVNGQFFSRNEIRAALGNAGYDRPLELGGRVYRRTAFGHWRLKE